MTAWGLALRNFVGPTEAPDIDGLIRYAVRAEELGFESLWAWDHVILGVDPSFPILDALGTLTAIAARTTRIRLGTGVLVLPLRNPIVVAKTLGTLDVISRGRLILGVAAGWYAREFDAVGVPFRQRGRLFERNLDLLCRLWTGDRVTARVDECVRELRRHLEAGVHRIILIPYRYQQDQVELIAAEILPRLR